MTEYRADRHLGCGEKRASHPQARKPIPRRFLCFAFRYLQGIGEPSFFRRAHSLSYSRDNDNWSEVASAETISVSDGDDENSSVADANTRKPERFLCPMQILEIAKDLHSHGTATASALAIVPMIKLRSEKSRNTDPGVNRRKCGWLTYGISYCVTSKANDA